MIIAGQPVLATILRVDLGVVPLQVVRGRLTTASGGADQAFRVYRKRIDAAKRHARSAGVDYRLLRQPRR